MHAESRLRDRHDENAKNDRKHFEDGDRKERKKESMERMSIVGDSIIEVPGLHF